MPPPSAPCPTAPCRRDGLVHLRAGRPLRAGSFAASLLAVIPLTLLARIFAIVLKAPVTIFLLAGIFPLVPGAGIYYTAYYFIQGNNALALANGISTFKIAVALAIGIALVLGFRCPASRAAPRNEQNAPALCRSVFVHQESSSSCAPPAMFSWKNAFWPFSL